MRKRKKTRIFRRIVKALLDDDDDDDIMSLSFSLQLYLLLSYTHLLDILVINQQIVDEILHEQASSSSYSCRLVYHITQRAIKFISFLLLLPPCFIVKRAARWGTKNVIACVSVNRHFSGSLESHSISFRLEPLTSCPRER